MRVNGQVAHKVCGSHRAPVRRAAAAVGRMTDNSRFPLMVRLAIGGFSNEREMIAFMIILHRQISPDFDTVWPNPIENARVVWQRPDSKLGELTERVKMFTIEQLSALFVRGSELDNGVMITAALDEMHRRAVLARGNGAG